MSQTDHAPFAPSGMAILVACQGSYQLTRTMREAGTLLNDEDTPKSMEGTAAHWVASEALECRWHQAGTLAPNGIAVTEEMLEGAEIYSDAIAPYRTGGHIEEQTQCLTIDPNCWGTPDYWQYDAASNTLFVADYKFGHRYVDVFENWQLLTYMFGIIASNNIDVATLNVILCVIQPRSFHRDGPVRTWKFIASKVTMHQRIIQTAVRNSAAPDASCKPSPECCDCKARHGCIAAQQAELAAFDLAGDTAPLKLSDDAKSLRLRQIHRAQAHLKAMESGLSEDIEATIRGGKSVAGFTLEAGVGREKWTKPVDEVAALGAMLGINVTKPALVTPTQAKKAGLSADVIAAYAARESTGLKLVESDSKKLKSVFSS